MFPVRLNKVTYPNDRVLGYNYAAGVDAVMSRLSSIFDDADADGVLDAGETVDASYKYLGLGQIVEEDYADIAVKLSYLDGSGNVTGLDRFGRVADQIWTDYGANPGTLDEYTYTYDRAGNRTAKNNTQHTAFNESYTYDNLNRLTDTDRADSFDQSWGLDGLGNFSSFDDDGTSQTRTTNAANEITGISGNWIDPVYDAAGNMTSGAKGGAETTRLHYKYDAWNRLVAVYDDDSGSPGDLIVAYEYDGANRRIEKTFADDTGREYFYNQQWQLLEERFVNGGGTATSINQYVWSPRYIDAPIVRYHDGNADGDCNISTDANDTIRYYTGDANFNVTTTITYGYNSAKTTQHFVYSAYGEATVYDNNWSNAAAPSEDGPTYSGYFFDFETGNDLARTRFFSIAYATWIIRDPIEADINLYRYVGGNPLRDTDPSGLVWALYDIPASWWKCAIVAEALSMGSGVDKELLGHWLYGKGSAKVWNAVGFNEFDSDGSQRSGVMQSVYLSAIVASRNLTCGQSKSGTWKQARPRVGNAFSDTKMISNYEFWADCTYTVTKQCDHAGCCKSISISASCNYHAWDRVDFWNNPNSSFGLFGIHIADRLVRACYPAGRGFDLTSNVSGTKSWTIPCSPKACAGNRYSSDDNEQEPNNRDYFIDQNGNVISWDRGTCEG